MAVKNTKAIVKHKATISNKPRVGSSKRKKGKRRARKERNVDSNILFVITFLTGILLIVSSYAWLSASLNVKIKFFDLSVSTDNGLFISLDGIDYSDSVEISINSVINDLKKTYPNHTNQWATAGLWPVSSNGIRTANNDKFDMFVGEMSKYKDKRKNRRFLNTKLFYESEPSPFNAFISFDIFLKNVSGSPKSDNLYLQDTSIQYNEMTDEEDRESMQNIMNSMRFGFVRIGSTSAKSPIKTIQNMQCNNNCQMLIYEPNSIAHSIASIDRLKDYGINLVDGTYVPTYGVINEGNFLEHLNGQEGSGIPLDTAHFAKQNTFTSFGDPIYQIPNGVTKMRVYVWVEGQDIDSLETFSVGAAIDIAINFVKDLAGYE